MSIVDRRSVHKRSQRPCGLPAGAGLNAEAGLSIIDYSASAQASWGKGDIIMWSDTAGLYGGGTVSVSDLNWADNNNHAYYGRKVEPDQILAGQVITPDAIKLRSALPS